MSDGKESEPTNISPTIAPTEQSLQQAQTGTSQSIQETSRPLLRQEMDPNTSVKHWLSSVSPTPPDTSSPEKK